MSKLGYKTAPLVARVKTVPIREAFHHEARNFTTWLETNIDALAERLGMTLTVLGREQEAGDFNVDLLCGDESGNRVVIENQLGATDHKHLGQVLTYLVKSGAKAAIWVALEARAEHKLVVEWLNENSAADIRFYLVKVEAIQIAGSPLAPMFSVLVAPDAEVKKIGEQKKDMAALDATRRDFWVGLLKKLRDRGDLFSNVSSSTSHYIKTGTGLGGVVIQCVLNKQDAYIELYIDRDLESGDGNKRIFDLLYKHQAAIESSAGMSLTWRRLESSRVSRVEKRFADGGYSTPQTWPTLQEKMTDAVIRLSSAFKPYLREIAANERV